MKTENRPTLKKAFSTWLIRFFNLIPQNKEELIRAFQEFQKKQIIDADTFNMIEGVLDISEQRVRDIMIPRSQIIAIKNDFNINECLKVIFENGHSRYPIINEDKDHIEGILLAKDLICYMQKGDKEFNLKSVIRPATVVPEAKRVDLMLKEFRMHRYHMAIVVDEFGGVSGLVTIEDILELIVGDIDDEYDEIEDVYVKQINDTNFTVSALMPIDEFNDHFNLKFKNNDVDTIGGLVMQHFGRLPLKGESIIINNISFKVTLADKRRIIQLQVSFNHEINLSK